MHDFIWATYMEVERIVSNIPEEEYANTIQAVYQVTGFMSAFKLEAAQALFGPAGPILMAGVLLGPRSCAENSSHVYL
jgi:hypothetical protein